MARSRSLELSAPLFVIGTLSKAGSLMSNGVLSYSGSLESIGALMDAGSLWLSGALFAFGSLFVYGVLSGRVAHRAWCSLVPWLALVEWGSRFIWLRSLNVGLSCRLAHSQILVLAGRLAALESTGALNIGG